jgi:hypothetical protein
MGRIVILTDRQRYAIGAVAYAAIRWRGYAYPWDFARSFCAAALTQWDERDQRPTSRPFSPMDLPGLVYWERGGEVMFPRPTSRQRPGPGRRSA